MEYYLCSEGMAYGLKTKESSKKLKWGKTNVLIAKINFKEASDFYDTLDIEHKLFAWCQQITDINLDVEEVYDFNEIKQMGLFKWIMYHFDLSTTRNISGIIGRICKFEGITPVEFFNKLNK